LISSLSEIGFAMPGMSGAIPINYQEIEAWSRLTHTYLPWYEPALLRKLSREYCAELQESKKVSRKKPSDDSDIDEKAAADSFRNVLNFYKD